MNQSQRRKIALLQNNIRLIDYLINSDTVNSLSTISEQLVMDNRYNLNRLAYFVATVEEGTITAAAERLGLSKAVVSKQLQLLEEDVGIALLHRNTRSMKPTDAGAAFYTKSKAVLIQATEAFDLVLERAQVPTGRLRVAAPVDYGVAHVAPLVAKFRDRYPRVDVELILGDDVVDLIDQRYDLAFRVGWLTDSSNLARKLKDFEELVVCSPETLKNHQITKPEDLATLPFIANLAIGGQTKWTFNRGRSAKTVEMQQAISMNITLAIRNTVLAGSAFTILPDLLVNQDIAEGKLIRLLPDWSLRTGGVYIVSPPSRLRSSAVQAFLDTV